MFIRDVFICMSVCYKIMTDSYHFLKHPHIQSQLKNNSHVHFYSTGGGGEPLVRHPWWEYSKSLQFNSASPFQAVFQRLRPIGLS